MRVLAALSTALTIAVAAPGLPAEATDNQTLANTIREHIVRGIEAQTSFGDMTGEGAFELAGMRQVSASASDEQRYAERGITLRSPRIFRYSNTGVYVTVAKFHFNGNIPETGDELTIIGWSNIGKDDGFAVKYDAEVTDLGSALILCPHREGCRRQDRAAGGGFDGPVFEFQDQVDASRRMTNHDVGYIVQTFAHKPNATGCVQAKASYVHTWNQWDIVQLEKTTGSSFSLTLGWKVIDLGGSHTNENTVVQEKQNEVWAAPSASSHTGCSDPLSIGTSTPITEGSSSPQPATVPLNPSNVSDGTLMREPSGLVAVAAGGAPHGFASWGELSSLGYGNAPIRDVAAGFFGQMRSTPVDGTLVRRADGWEGVVAGGHAYGFNSWDEKNAAGYGSRAAVTIPGRNIDALLTTPPTAGAIVAKPVGSLWMEAVVAAGRAFPFGSWSEKQSLGYASSRATSIPGRDFDALAAAPVADRTIIAKPVDGAWMEAVTGGGQAFPFASWSEKNALGYGSMPAVPIPVRDFNALASTHVADGTIVAKMINGIGLEAVVAGGAAFGLASGTEKATLGHSGKPVVFIPDRNFDALASARVADGTVVAKMVNGIGLEAVTAGGQAFGLASYAEKSQLGHTGKTVVFIPDRNFDPMAAANAADGTVLRNGSTGELAVILGGKKRIFTSSADFASSTYQNNPVTTIPTRNYNALATA
ncbi:hypothetical protein [Longispora albida]|uniref:hypothetical protein n=1 Tax=Longispora albida TaxID=203523 RepID=UPI0012F71404|nr:hypothetical protein [Longispora albida]